MENKIQFTAKAKKDLEESVNFYEDRKLGLGKNFLNTIKEKTLEIKSQPEKNPSSEDGVKKTKVKKFPFYIYYIFKSPLVIIIAIWHVARLPFSRKERIKDINE
ncbi:MAG: type II toxin-antitoxin system RelE/ParE family toxin [Leptospiraceae bacterium]|nr:type II toxin-antitoxin system RelE/ParE family toxin [Leptospiraceae bacterium]